MFGRQKPKKGVSFCKMQARITLLSFLRPSRAPTPEARHGCLPRERLCSGQGLRGRGSWWGGPRTKKAFLELSTPEASELAKGKGRKKKSQ